MASKKLNKKQNNQAAVKALELAAKQIATEGVEALPAGSYPFGITVALEGELLVKKGTDAGEEIIVPDFTPADVLRGLMATTPNFTTAVSEALAWHKKASKEDKKAQDAKSAAAYLKCASRRKMTKTHCSPARAGAVSAKPTVKVEGLVGSRQIDVEVGTAA